MIDYTYKVNRIGIVNKIWYNYYINDFTNNTNKFDILDFIKEIDARKEKETKKELYLAYENRIEKSYDFISKIENKMR